MVERVKMLTIYERTPTAKQLGERLRVTNAERERLKLWQFKPIDATDEQVAEQRRARRNERRRVKRGRTRAEYLATSLNRQRPWEAEGISRGTWYRRRAISDETSVGPIIVTKAESIPVSPSVGETLKGFQGGGAVVRLRETTDAQSKEWTASGPPHLYPHLSQREQTSLVFVILAHGLAESDPKMAWAMLAHFAGQNFSDEHGVAA